MTCRLCRVLLAGDVGASGGAAKGVVGNVAAHLGKAKPEVWETVVGECMLM